MAKNWFNRSLPIPKIRHSYHDLSNDYKSSINFGGLYPTYVEECVPSDKFKQLSSEVFLRFAPMKFPIMHRCKVRNNFFGVPYRLIMGDELYFSWLRGEHDIPACEIGNATASTVSFKNTIVDYLGLQPFDIIASGSVNIGNPIPLLSVWLIWLVWYSDEVLDQALIQKYKSAIDNFRSAMENDGYMDAIVIGGTAGWTMDDFVIPPISYEKDYFTAAQTEPQRGGDVYLMSPLSLSFVNGSLPSVNTTLLVNTQGEAYTGQNGPTDPVRTTDTIRDLWQREQLQRYRDISALYGDERSHEYLAGHFGVISSDARIQLPQFIGGGEQIVQIQEVVQTSSDTSTSPMGSLAGKGSSFGRTRNYMYFCEEHMTVLGLLSVVPDNGYMTGNPRWSYKKNILDFASPEFNNIGYQPVYNGEIYSSGIGSPVDTQEFGYQPRYSEYRVHRSIATGDFRDSTLMAWHLNRSFSSLPPLNAAFIHVNKTDSARIFNNTDPTAQHIYIDVYNKVGMIRPVSYMPSSLHL